MANNKFVVVPRNPEANRTEGKRREGRGRQKGTDRKLDIFNNGTNETKYDYFWQSGNVLAVSQMTKYTLLEKSRN